MLSAREIHLIRNFNRDYTSVLGILNKRVFDTDLSWPEGRILLEIAFNKNVTPAEISTKLQIDKSYTSRIINRLVAKDLVIKTASPSDSRSVILCISNTCEPIIQNLNKKSDLQVEQLVDSLSDDEQTELFQAFETLENLLFGKKA